MEIRDLLDRMAENLSVRRSFGAAYERDGALIIPVALAAGGGGGGEGPVKPPTTKEAGATKTVKTVESTKDAPPDTQTPIGMGGGFGGLVLPLGVYVVKDDQVRWLPAYDVTLIVLAGLGVVRFLLRLLTGSRQRAVGSGK